MYFTNPLLRILVSQRLQINHLTAAVIAKDVEIQQYKLNGATLVREQLATQEFNEQQFNEKYAVKDVEGFGKMLLTESACDNLKVALKIKDTTEKVSAVGKASSSIIKLPSKPKNKVNRPKDRKIMNHQQKDIKLRYESSEELIDMSAIPVNVEQVTQSISSISTPAKKKPKLFNRPLDI